MNERKTSAQALCLDLGGRTGRLLRPEGENGRSKVTEKGRGQETVSVLRDPARTLDFALRQDRVEDSGQKNDMIGVKFQQDHVGSFQGKQGDAMVDKSPGEQREQ